MGLLHHLLEIPKCDVNPLFFLTGLGGLEDEPFICRFAFVVGTVVAWPISFSTLILFANNQADFRAVELRREFYTQCLVNSLPALFMILTVRWFSRQENCTNLLSLWSIIFILSGVIGAGVFFVYQYVALNLSISRPQPYHRIIFALLLGTAISLISSFCLSQILLSYFDAISLS